MPFHIYSHLALETTQQVQSQINQREQLLHALRIEKEKLEQLYTFHTTQKELYVTLETLPAFCEAIKLELLALLSSSRKTALLI